MNTPQFRWDPRKAARNRRQHGVRFEEATTVFADPLAAIFEDDAHSDDEQRELIVGHSEQQRLLIVSFTERGDHIRIISARQVTPQERRDYEEYAGF